MRCLEPAAGSAEDLTPELRRSPSADGVVPTASSEIEAKAESAKQWLHAYFRKFRGRSLADELIAERRNEARGRARKEGS